MNAESCYKGKGLFYYFNWTSDASCFSRHSEVRSGVAGDCNMHGFLDRRG